MDHLFDCEFRCEDRYARWISVDVGKTILVAPELARFSHSQDQTATSDPFVCKSAKTSKAEIASVDHWRPMG